MARYRARCEWWKHGDVDADGPSITCETEAELDAWMRSAEVAALLARADGSYVPMFFAEDSATGRTWALSPPSQAAGRPEL